MKILLASTNKGKIKEFTEILSGPGITIVTPGDMGLSLEVEENGATFAENALLKARQWSRAAEMPVLADDSGLCVEALGGRPGVLTARFAGPGAGDKDNYRLLLSCLEDTEDRRAKFVCAVALAFADGRVVQAEGEYEGVICHEPAGDQGFGYDPVFFDPTMGKTLAQMSPEEKNARSHRRKAIEALKKKLAGLGYLD